MTSLPLNESVVFRISEEVIDSLPSFLLLLPSQSADCTNDWRVLFGDAIPLDIGVKGELLRRSLTPRAFERLCNPGCGLNGEIPLKDLILTTQEHTLQLIYRPVIMNPGHRWTSFTRVMRQTWERISGQHSEHSMPSHYGLDASLKRAKAALAEVVPLSVQQFLEPIHRYGPVILSSRFPGNTTESMAWPLKREILHRLSDGWRNEISLDDIDKEVLIANPFFQTISRVCTVVRDTRVNDVGEEDEIQRDRVFLEHFKGHKLLHGVGEYRGFSLDCYKSNGESFARLGLCFSDKPFLQQVDHDPIFIFWDFEKNPVFVFIDGQLEMPGNEQNWQLAEARLLIHCRHPSIWSHAFVKSIDRRRSLGAICTEDTLNRTISMHNRFERFDPISCLLDQIRTAGRILKYGVRQRDRAIPQYNVYVNVPENEFQAVIKGWDEAHDFAKKHGAEIVPYER
jgi:hypothetical protein